MLAEKAVLEKYNEAHSSASRFMGSWGKSYSGIAPHGFNVWESNPNCKCMKDGKEITGCTGIDAAEGCSLKFMTKEASYYGMGGGRAHHPTRAFHMLRGEAITWLYTLAMLDAIYTMEADLKTMTEDALREVYEERLDKLRQPMPAPKKCQNYHCDAKPMCYTNYMPHFNQNQLLTGIMVGSHNWTLVGGIK